MSNLKVTKKKYDKYLSKIHNRMKLNKKCNQRYTSNPDNVFLLGNTCDNYKNKNRKTRKHNKSHKTKRRYKSTPRRGGGFMTSVSNSVHTFGNSVGELPAPVSANPWEGNFSHASSWM